MLSRLLALVGLALAAMPGLSSAQTYPDRPIKLIVPFPAGGSVDAMARLVAQQLTTRVGTVLVENRPGAGATIGVRSVATAAPDGYTLLFGSAGSLCVAPALYANADYDPVKSFAPVGLVSLLPPVFVVNPSVPANTIQEFVAYAKANPGKLNYGAALGTPPHLSGALFKARTGIDVTYVPYKGAAQSVTDLLGGQTHFSIDALTSYYPLILQGKVKALAVASSARWPALPNVPTLIESGYADISVDAWTGVVAPAGTPQDIVKRLNTALNEALADPHVIAQLKDMSGLPRAGTPQDFAAFIASESKKWAEIVKISGAKVE